MKKIASGRGNEDENPGDDEDLSKDEDLNEDKDKDEDELFWFIHGQDQGEQTHGKKKEADKMRTTRTKTKMSCKLLSSAYHVVSTQIRWSDLSVPPLEASPVGHFKCKLGTSFIGKRDVR